MKRLTQLFCDIRKTILVQIFLLIIVFIPIFIYHIFKKDPHDNCRVGKHKYEKFKLEHSEDRYYKSRCKNCGLLG